MTLTDTGIYGGHEGEFHDSQLKIKNQDLKPKWISNKGPHRSRRDRKCTHLHLKDSVIK